MRADITTWIPDAPFDVILDMGCLHSLPLLKRETYRQQLCRWLAPGGDIVLIHCGSRGWWDRFPVGPHRISRQAVVDLFSPELKLRVWRRAPQLADVDQLLGPRVALLVFTRTSKYKHLTKQRAATSIV